MGRNGTLLRVVQGRSSLDVAGFHSKGLELELGRLEDYLARSSTPEVSR